MTQPSLRFRRPDVAFGRECVIASNTILNAAKSLLISLGDAQDNADLTASASHLEFGVMVSIAHQTALETRGRGGVSRQYGRGLFDL